MLRFHHASPISALLSTRGSLARAVLGCFAASLLAASAAVAETVYSTSFSAAEGYATGSIDGQQGWRNLQETARGRIFEERFAPSADRVVRFGDDLTGQTDVTFSDERLSGEAKLVVTARMAYEYGEKEGGSSLSFIHVRNDAENSGGAFFGFDHNAGKATYRRGIDDEFVAFGPVLEKDRETYYVFVATISPVDEQWRLEVRSPDGELLAEAEEILVCKQIGWQGFNRVGVRVEGGARVWLDSIKVERR